MLKGLVVTCLDQRPDFVFNKKALPKDIEFTLGSFGPDSKYFAKLWKKY